MVDQHIEAVFENGVFLPLQPVHLPEHQRVTLVLSSEKEALEEEVGYEPLPLYERKTIRVRIKYVGDVAPLPYPVEADDLEQE